MKSRAYVDALEVSERPHKAWRIQDKPHHEADDELPTLTYGPFVGRIEPSAHTPSPQQFMQGTTAPGAQGPVTFRTFTGSERSGTWPPDCSGARGGDVVLMSGNLWLKLSVDRGVTFTDLDFTKLFAADTTYGGWAGDQVVIYVPSIDCFVLYVQSYAPKSGTRKNQNVVKLALASPADLIKHKGGKAAWGRQWNFTSDTFGLGATWLDFPDLSYGQNYLFVNTNLIAGTSRKLFWELPLADLAAGRSLSFLFAVLTDSVGSPIQNISGDDSYFAGHINNSTMRIFHSRGGDPNYDWRDRNLANWPMTTDNDIVSAAPDWKDWVSEDHRIIGATRRRNELWFAWSASTGDGGGGGFKFPHAHVQIAKFDLTQDYKLLEQTQVWNPDHAYCYPSLTTNADDEVGISLAWGGGGKYYGSHAVGILGDFVVWYGEASDETSLRQAQDDDGNLLTNPDGTPLMYSRWGDYVHVRLAHPDRRFFSAFGYAVHKDPAGERMQFLYVEFGRQALPYPGLR
ncbi:MAG: hypothetical protein HOQ45_01785 [Nocardioidaceae bacterium]|nr:hypothetical protein [Nocardioidaceae bacterium]